MATGDWAPYSDAVGSGQYIQPADDGVWDALNPRWTLSRCVQRPASPARRRHRLVVAYASLSHVGALGHARGGQRSRSVRRPLAASADARARRRRDDLRRRLDVQSRGRMGHLRRRTPGDYEVVRLQPRGGLACVGERPKTGDRRRRPRRRARRPSTPTARMRAAVLEDVVDGVQHVHVRVVVMRRRGPRRVLMASGPVATVERDKPGNRDTRRGPAAPIIQPTVVRPHSSQRNDRRPTSRLKLSSWPTIRQRNRLGPWPTVTWQTALPAVVSEWSIDVVVLAHEVGHLRPIGL